jgi:hypothetical protein
MKKEEQKQHLIDMMRYDAILGLYKETEQMNVGGGSGSLPERKAELLQTLKKLQEENKITDEEFQKGYYNGFEDGCNAMIEFLSGNGA